MTLEAARYTRQLRDLQRFEDRLRHINDTLDAKGSGLEGVVVGAVEELRGILRANIDHAQSSSRAYQELIDAIRAASVTFRGDIEDVMKGARLDEFLDKVGEAVHINGYAALDLLVKDELKASNELQDKRWTLAKKEMTTMVVESEKRISKACADLAQAMQVNIHNIEAIAAGKPTLPVSLPGVSFAQRLRTAVLTPIVLFRRWCMDAMAPAVVLACFTIFIYVAFALRHLMQ